VVKNYEDLETKLENSEANELKTSLQSSEQDLRKIEKTLNNLEIEFTKKQTTLNETISQGKTSTRKSLEEKIASISDIVNKISKMNEELNSTQSLTNELEKKISIKNQAVAKLLKEKKQKLFKISKFKSEIAQLNDQIYPIKLQLNKNKMKTEEYETKILEWNAKIETKISIPDSYLIQSLKEHKQILSNLNTEKNELGAVNLRAIEKYQDIETRYNELETKNEQVIKEREAILDFIEMLEKEKKRVFMNTFNAINKNFGYIFAKLSPGGDARLHLLNPEEPFEGGIEIVARPGEKEKCNVMALSGGERTLTIIALILGIQMHVPSPYYVLDEIDAALDDVNAALVADMIKELAEKSQFIIITHRDVTMARVDQLLGVSNIEGVTLVLNLSIQSVLNKLKSGENLVEAT
jgi:chromosome segregation protein